jgi:ribonuclease HI
MKHDYPIYLTTLQNRMCLLMAIKSQILPDFTAEWLELQSAEPPDLSSVWTMYFDGSKRIQGAGAGVVLISPQGDKLKYVLRMSFPQASNNEAEYEALLHGMKMAKECGATRLKIFGDSNLIVQQVMNKCDAVSDNMTAYRNLYYYLEGTFDGCEVLRRNHRKINKKQQNFDYRGTRPTPSNMIWGWKSKHSRISISHDDRRNLDAAISGIHNKQNATRRHGRSKKDNTTIQGFHRITGKII